MSVVDNQCDCCEPTAEQPTDRPTASGHWLAERPVTDATLPSDVSSRMSRLVGAERIETLDDLVAAAREATGGGSLAVGDLCHVAEETPHSATMDGETYRFRCFYDGIALSHIADEPVEIRTKSPTGEPIEVRASPDGAVDVTPPEAAMSFGVGTDVAAPPADGPSAVEANMCPYVKAFPSREAYERWADRVDAATVGMPLADGVPVAAALAE